MGWQTSTSSSGAESTLFWRCHFMLVKMIVLPSQARDKHRERALKTRVAFLAGPCLTEEQVAKLEERGRMTDTLRQLAGV
jgi:hypothetical protein